MWYREQRWQSRLFAEQAVMHERFPGLSLRRKAIELFWEGTLQPIRGRRFQVRLIYPARFPYQEPVIRVLSPTLRSGTPHRYVDGSLCVHQAAWNPATGTAASMVPLASAWLATYLRWLKTGRWTYLTELEMGKVS